MLVFPKIRSLFVCVLCIAGSYLAACSPQKESGTEPEVGESAESNPNSSDEKQGRDHTDLESNAEKPDKPTLGTGKRANRPLKLIVTNLQNQEAPIMVGLFGPESDFPDAKTQLKEYTLHPKGETATLLLHGLAYGDFALALYQDIDGNGKINKNGIGIPTEPYAFSNDFRPKVREPKFEQCKFTFSPTNNILTVKMGK